MLMLILMMLLILLLLILHFLLPLVILLNFLVLLHLTHLLLLLFWGRRPLLGKKVDILDFLGHLKAKCAEIWSENRFLKMIRGDFDFGHFQPFLAELWHFFVFENGQNLPIFFFNEPRGT